MTVALLVSTEVATAIELARDWTADGVAVTLVLLDGAAAHARARHARAAQLAALVATGVTVRAHDAALARRGIGPPDLAEGVKPCTLDEVADLLCDGADRAMWL